MIKNRTELMKWIEKAEGIIERYGWQDKVVHPYPNCPIKASKIINDCKDYDICTDGSRTYLIDLANGFNNILESWVRYEETPKVTVRILKSGKIAHILKSDLEMFEGLIEVI